MTSLRFNVHWHGEAAAGIRPGYENVVITFEYTGELDADTVEYWREAIRDYYDGATVETEQEAQKRLRLENACPECGHPKHAPGECIEGSVDRDAVNTFGYDQEWTCECNCREPNQKQCEMHGPRE